MSNSFRNAFTEFKRHLPLILSVALVSLMIAIVYGRDLLILANEAVQTEALTHIVIVPLRALQAKKQKQAV